jgi:hypothetical protein
MFNKIKSIFKKPEPVKAEPKEKKPRKPKEPKVKIEPTLTEKEKATQAGEPYIAITKVDIDPNDMHNGAFELDWNDKFIINLIKNGYKQRDDDTDQMMDDRWFQSVCRNVAIEIYEQQQADPENRYRAEMRFVRNKDLGDGRTEVS